MGEFKKLFEFQEKCVEYLIDKSSENDKEVTILKAPTGAGKTIIVQDYINNYIVEISNKVSFIWLCPGDGNLEEQSMKKMVKRFPKRNIKDLHELMKSGFEGADITFINWELITKKGNKAITENEKKNLFDFIADAHRNGLEFIIIIDEEHNNNTAKANDILRAFSSIHTIRISATTKENKKFNFYEIPELDVINAGLITNALYINENVQAGINIENENEYLIELADSKRKMIAKEYEKNRINCTTKINPLILIQFPDMSQDLIKLIENKLDELGYNYENRLVAKWMSKDCDKVNKDGIENDDSKVCFLLMKQAIATGWDCPRAKILVKLRENMSENFTIQTIGRIRRMPEAIHYNNELLDNCYLYTFDEQYKESIKKEIVNAYDVKRLFLKEKCKTFSLTKQLKNLDNDGLGERESYEVLYKFFIDKYGMTLDKEKNKILLEAEGYILNEELIRNARKGKFIKVNSILDKNIGEEIKTYRTVNTHKNGIEFMHSINVIKSKIGIKQSKLKAILERLFRKDDSNYKKILDLNTKLFYAFIINNEKKLKNDFVDATSKLSSQIELIMKPKEVLFKIPEQDLIKYDPNETDIINFLSNAYEGYTDASIIDGLRSMSERLFERYCEDNNNIDWVYKNGDKGLQYFSIVYIDSIQNQWLFYPDYIVRLKNGDVWIIETKGGEQKYGQDKNIDKQVENKFEAFKNYALKNNVKWGFVRDKNEKLKINNTHYVSNMNDEEWEKIEYMF